MPQRCKVSGVRREYSSQRTNRALNALVGTLLAFASVAHAQDLQLPPTVESEADSDQTTPAEQLAAEEMPAPRAALGKPNPATTLPQPSNDLRAALERPGTLNLHDVELRAALFMISEQWGINIVAGKVEGSVNGVFRNAPLQEILDSILLSNGYNYRAVGESLVVSSIEDLGQINPLFQSATIPVYSADIDEVVEGAKLLCTPQGHIQPIKSARSIVVLDFPDRVKMIREFVASIDSATQSGMMGGGRAGAPMEVGYFRTQHVPAKAAEEALQAVLSKEGRVGVMEKDDRLVISDHAENLAMVKTVLERIDRPRPQVRITALIYDISLEDIEQLGINWRQAGLARDGRTLLGIDSVTKIPFEVGTVGSALTFMNLSEHLDMNAVVLALNTARDARLLANPSVAVLENEEAVFQSVSEIPYQQLTQTSLGGDIGTTAFKEAGITLRVIPKITADGTIRMVVSPEFSRLTGFTPGDNQPIIDKRVATTTLDVANRQTIVIGGLRERRDVGDFNGVPYLMDMKYVGKLFRSRDTNVRESELVLFISPEIITSADPVTHRDHLIIDTVGCRLNQIPEGEGCVPPPPCVYQQGYGPGCRNCTPQPLTGPVRLPAAQVVADRPTSVEYVAAAPPRRLPTVLQTEAAPIELENRDLFESPPAPEIDLGLPKESKPSVGGFMEVGVGPIQIDN